MLCWRDELRGLLWASAYLRSHLHGDMLGHGSRGGEEDESAHRMQHVYTARGCVDGVITVRLMIATPSNASQNFQAMRQKLRGSVGSLRLSAPLWEASSLGMPRRTERRFVAWPAVCGCEAQGFVHCLRTSLRMHCWRPPWLFAHWKLVVPPIGTRLIELVD